MSQAQYPPTVRFTTNIPVQGLAVYDGGPLGPNYSQKFHNWYYRMTWNVAGSEASSFMTHALAQRLQTLKGGDNVSICKVERPREDGQGLFKGWDVYINGAEAPVTELPPLPTEPPADDAEKPQAPVQAVSGPSKDHHAAFGELEGLMGHCLLTAKQTWVMIMDDVNSDAIQRLAVSMAIACLDRNINIAAPPTTPPPAPTPPQPQPQQQAPPQPEPPPQIDDDGLPF